MTREKELMLVKEIISDGYENLDVISFELDIPIQQLVIMKKQIETEKRKAMIKARKTKTNNYSDVESSKKLRAVTQKL